MSLSRLLRIASPKVCEPLTFAAASGGPRGEREGEIVFSKNNVCVHTTEALPGETEHRPGYLCVHMEKDEELDNTLILTWVPNSRIQRQDEEALRYVTPEGSPMHSKHRRSPRCSSPSPPEEEPEPAGQSTELQHQEEGQQEPFSLPVDLLSHESTEGSGQDSAPSPFCLWPVSEVLAECSGSVLQEHNGRETRDKSVTLSACSDSSLSQNSPVLSGDSQSQSTGWEEQQKAQASEPLCGVFRVDLGHMRSLRLFFSDEACASGQLVIASPENQFKILHFHHAGLDKLAEVFQQWKCCQETQLKDQVLDGRSCVQFSVLRPSRPSADSHPEESLQRQLDRAAWLELLGRSGQVEQLHELLKAVFFGGIEPAVRAEAWPFLLRYYSWGSSPEERGARRQQKHARYREIQQRRLSMSLEEQSEFWRKVQFTVDRDVVRTDCGSPFFSGEDNANVESMRRILLNYALFNSELGYCQGMSDLVAPLLMELQDEGDTFWCFVGLMESSSFIGSPHEENMEKQLMYLREMLGLMVPRFHQHLTQLGPDGLQLLFCHRWLLLCFRREFPLTEVLCMWEACWTHYQTDYFHLFLCVAIIMLYGDDVAEQQLAADQILLHFSGLSMHMNGELVLRKARSLLYQFSHLPTVPCSLHSLRKL